MTLPARIIAKKCPGTLLVGSPDQNLHQIHAFGCWGTNFWPKVGKSVIFGHLPMVVVRSHGHFRHNVVSGDLFGALSGKTSYG